MSNPDNESSENRPTKRRYVKAVGPGLRKLLFVIFGLFALLGANSAYLGAITFLEWFRGETYQNYFYQFMFLAHLIVGLVFVIPTLYFSAVHLRNTWNRPNRRAVRVGYGLLAATLILLASGIALMRLDIFEIRDPKFRSISYWAHVVTPFVAAWLYILHRLAGPRIKWKVGVAWASVVVLVVGLMVALHTQDPRTWNVVGPKEGETYFMPSLARTSTGNFIPAKALMMDDYCKECHPDVFDDWFHSAHHFSSFNNPAYLFSIKETRAALLERDGNVRASRWCAGCHDPVPFFSGKFDDPELDLEQDITGHAGITCTVCHGITHVNSTKGNADFTIEEPVHYPFAYSDNPVLQYLNQQLVKGKPDFHKKVFLKPLHKTAEFCSVCHKVSLPGELTNYKEWLRGQNHYDNFLLSGVSGGAARSFYYPPHGEGNCNGCHMPLKASTDFGADYFEGVSERSVHDHLFPGGNTALPFLRNEPDIVARQQEILKDSLRVDLFGLRKGGTIDGELVAPLGTMTPTLEPGESYLIEVVLRTLKVGHLFTQGTVDSNEVWVDVEVLNDGKTIGRSGGLDPEDRALDEWAHRLNAYVLDRHGDRIDRRNAQDIFTKLYDHQMPPGTGQTIHYGITLPENISGTVTIRARLNYRKFDTTYMQYIYGEDYVNTLPVTMIGDDSLVLSVAGSEPEDIRQPSRSIPEWQRWNDYGIGLFLKGGGGSEKGELRQAEEAFKQVEALGRYDGPVNLARVYLKEGRVDDAVAALNRAKGFDPAPPRWTVAWFTGLVNQQNGFYDEAITSYRSILTDRYPELDERGFDFSQDYEVRNQLGLALYERGRLRRSTREGTREKFFREAIEAFEGTLKLDSENLTAHFNLWDLHKQLGETGAAEEHRVLFEKYRPDDNARDEVIAKHRAANDAADHAAQSVVIYPLQREGAPGW